MRKALFALLIGAVASPAHSATIDIRDCRLDTVIFVDPWADGTFAVKRVGNNHVYACPDGVKPPNIDCDGPYGDLVLEGEYRRYESSEPETISAIWSVAKALPCCGWSIESGVTSLDGKGQFMWLPAKDVPKLRDMPFLSIDPEGGSDLGNPVIAAACTTPRL